MLTLACPVTLGRVWREVKAIAAGLDAAVRFEEVAVLTCRARQSGKG